MGCGRHPHGHIQAFLDQIHHPVGQVQRHGQAWMSPHQPRDQRGNVQVAELDWRRHLQATDRLLGLAADIANEPGLRWKLWTEDAQAGIASGEDLFDSRAQAERYLDKHRARLQSFGAMQIRARVLDVNAALSLPTRAPLPPSEEGAPMFTTLAKVCIADAQRFLDVFSTRGLQARQSHGSRGAHAFLLPDDPGTAMVLIDWTDRASFDAFRTDPAVKDTMRSGGALEPPVFTVLERSGSFPA